jgi:hypothetical protein
VSKSVPNKLGKEKNIHIFNPRQLKGKRLKNWRCHPEVETEHLSLGDQLSSTSVPGVLPGTKELITTSECGSIIWKREGSSSHYVSKRSDFISLHPDTKILRVDANTDIPFCK